MCELFLHAYLALSLIYCAPLRVECVLSRFTDMQARSGQLPIHIAVAPGRRYLISFNKRSGKPDIVNRGLML